MGPLEKHVAILGGGAAGLSVALFLHGRRSQDRQTIFRCTVFDASPRLGGNCQTAYLGNQAFVEPFADLGVNDFNTERYKLLMGVLEKLDGFGYPILHRPIIDSTSWSTSPGASGNDRICYTDRDIKGRHCTGAGISASILMKIVDDWDRFQAISRDVIHDPHYAQMTVDEFIAEMEFSREFCEYNLFSCIGGMYFVDDRSPRSMPIRAIMNYYHLQKGVGLNPKVNSSLGSASSSSSPRHYFVNGASDWIRQLSRYLQDQGVEMRLGEVPLARLMDCGGWRVVTSASQRTGRETFDYVISAVHADTVQNVVQTGLPVGLSSLLEKFSYSESTAIVHDDASVLPDDPNAWSTYNLAINNPACRDKFPYVITYLEQKHHGQDLNSPPFVTLAPCGLEEESRIYEMLALPSQDRVKATVKFRHNRLSMDSVNAQKLLRHLQGQNNFYVTGGWTIGVGLHEEILAMSREVALRMRGFFLPGVHDEGYRDDQPSYLPKYIRDTFVDTPELFPAGFWD
jgi:predicted NAD/FAD-binding protein